MTRYRVDGLTPDAVLSTWEAQRDARYPGWLYSGGALRLLGMGGSFNAALAAAPDLRREGVPVAVDLASEHYRGDLSGIGAAETLVLISTSGESVELIDLAERLRAGGFRRTIALVGSAETPLAGLCSHVIELGIVDEQPIDSFVATVAALRRLGAAFSGRPLPDISADLEALEGAIGAGRTAEWGMPAPMVDLLGRGVLLGVARQAALLFREISRLPACSWEPNDFRHGPMESIREDQLTVLFADASPSTGDVDRRIARDLRAIPQRSLVVGGSNDADLLVRDAAVLSGVPQLAAMIPGIYAWGGQQGIEAGTFRYTRVTITEDV